MVTFVSKVGTSGAGVVVIAPAIFPFVAQMITGPAYPSVGGGCRHNGERKDRDNSRNYGLEHWIRLLAFGTSWSSLMQDVKDDHEVVPAWLII